MATQPYDVVIVGGGSAGLSAALVLGRARRSVVVIDAGEPRNAPAAHMHGYLSRDGMPPADFLAAGRAEAANYGVELIDDHVVGIDPGFAVRLATGRTVSGRRLLVSTGLRDQIPNIAGAQERWGRDLLHCPYCHGWEVRDRRLGVLGTNPGSIIHAQLIRQWSDDIVYFAHTQEPSAKEAVELAARGIRVVHGTVTRLVIDGDELTGVELDDGRFVARAAVFVRPVMTPHPDTWLTHLGTDVDGAGFPVTDRTGRTSVAGVWAAGNAADPRAQVITAAGAGSTAAIAINADLVEDDIAIAVRTAH